jgi:hypothetical protein
VIISDFVYGGACKERDGMKWRGTDTASKALLFLLGGRNSYLSFTRHWLVVEFS